MSLFTSAGIKVPKSILARNLSEAVKGGSQIGYPMVLKAQVLVGGRGKAGAVKNVSSEEELKKLFESLLVTQVRGEKPDSILLEEFVSHDKELYLSVTLDRAKRKYVLLASTEGGVEVENIGKIVSANLGSDTEKAAQEAGAKLGLEKNVLSMFVKLVSCLSDVASMSEAELVEINPLALIQDGEFVALDAKVILDDNALFRHPDLAALNKIEGLEAEASKYGFSYVELDGDVAVIGNGAGLVLASLDLVTDAGARPACFLDLGGGASIDRIVAALAVVTKLEKANSIFLNVFGGITRCPDVAQGIIEVIDKGLLKKKLYARISGAGEDEARKMLENRGVRTFIDADATILALMEERKST